MQHFIQTKRQLYCLITLYQLLSKRENCCQIIPKILEKEDHGDRTTLIIRCSWNQVIFMYFVSCKQTTNNSCCGIITLCISLNISIISKGTVTISFYTGRVEYSVTKGWLRQTNIQTVGQIHG